MQPSGHNPLLGEASQSVDVRPEAFWDFATRFGLLVASFPLLALVPDVLEQPALWAHFLASRCLWTALILAFPIAATRRVRRSRLPWILYGASVALLVLVIREQVWLGGRIPEILTTICLVFGVVPVMGVPFTWRENALGVLALLLTLNILCLSIPGLTPHLVRVHLLALFLVIATGFVHHSFDQMLQAQMLHQRQIEELARKDALTGLWNRRHFRELGELILKRCLRSRQGVSLILLDLDHFKAVNDRYGHGAGDAVIRACAACMAHAVRETDVVARIGGEEFVLLLDGSGLEAGLQVAERVRAGIEALSIAADGLEAPLRVTASLGVAGAEPPDLTLDGLMSLADQALYRAKGTGRNRVEPCRDADAPADSGREA